MTTIRDRVRPVQGNHEQHYHLPTPSNSPAASINNTTSFGIPTMNQTNTTAWVTFTYVSFGVAAGMTALGIWGLPADIWVKGYLSMATVFLIGSCFSLAKTLRDEHEAKRLTNRIEDAKAEKLLMGIDRG